MTAFTFLWRRPSLTTTPISHIQLINLTVLEMRLNEESHTRVGLNKDLHERSNEKGFQHQRNFIGTPGQPAIQTSWNLDDSTILLILHWRSIQNKVQHEPQGWFWGQRIIQGTKSNTIDSSIVSDIYSSIALTAASSTALIAAADRKTITILILTIDLQGTKRFPNIHVTVVVANAQFRIGSIWNALLQLI